MNPKTPTPQVSPLVRAVLRGDLSEISRLLENGAEANARDPDGRTALHQAALDNHAIICQVLLDHQADVNAQDPLGFVPLHFAAQDYSLDSARVLVNRGAVVDSKNKHGNTPLFTAVFNSKGRGDMIKLLLAAGADPMATNLRGISPLKLARTIANYNVKQFFDGWSKAL